VREDPKILVDDPKRELRAFTVSLTANVGTKRGQGKGSFVSSVVSAIDRFYAEVVQHIKPWTQAPPKVKDDEPSLADQAAETEISAAEVHDIEIGNGLPSRESALAPTLGLTESPEIDNQSLSNATWGRAKAVAGLHLIFRAADSVEASTPGTPEWVARQDHPARD
jgi:hypothetical protein